MLSTEVGEHVPPERELFFMGNLNRSARVGIVLTWAQTQNGIHMNPRPKKYVIEQGRKHFGWVNDDAAAQKLASHTHIEWYKDTVMVFRK